MSKEGVSGGGWGMRWGGRSLVITGDRSARRRLVLVLDSREGDFFDEEMDDVLRFWGRFRRERLGVVAETGESEATTGAGSITMGGTTLRGAFASEAFLGRGLVSLDEADAFDSAGDGVLLMGAGVLDTPGGGAGALWEASFTGAPFGLEPRSSGWGEWGPAALCPPRPPPRPPRPLPLPGRPRFTPRKAEPVSPPRPHPCLPEDWLAHIDEPTPPEGVDGDAAEAMEMKG